MTDLRRKDRSCRGAGEGSRELVPVSRRSAGPAGRDDGEFRRGDSNRLILDARRGEWRVGHPATGDLAGDRFGASAEKDIVELVEAVFASSGLRVARNSSLAGICTAQRYGRSSSGRHVLQVEIDRTLRIEKRLVRPNGEFCAFRVMMHGVVVEIVGGGGGDRQNFMIAAELSRQEEVPPRIGVPIIPAAGKRSAAGSPLLRPRELPEFD